MFTLISILPFFVVPILISLTDFVTVVRSRRSKSTTHTPDSPEHDDFTVLIPIFGDLSYLKNIEFLKQYSSHVVLCTTTRESEKFNNAIEEICRIHGFRIFRSEVPLAASVGKPNPWRLFSHTLHGTVEEEINREIARDEIIKDSFAVVKTEYCIFLDGDTVVKDSLYRLAGLMHEHKFDVASVRVLASKTDTLMEKLQSVEYQLAMDARKVYPWLTSGAGVVAKTKAIKNIMRHHSLFFSGGDIEIGKLAGMMGYKVGHLHFEFYTDVPSTFKAWFKQRMAWFGGGFRHAIVNAHSYTWRHPYFYFYTTILVYGATPLRWYEVFKYPEILPLVIVLYWILVFAFHWKQRAWYMFLFPFYALVQVMILVPLGIYTYFKMAYNANNSGIIALRHEYDYF
jgi:cellulose synthase/poly-beta-1,6-N-acetylglucosamine synthase-like glycosyltransferase